MSSTAFTLQAVVRWVVSSSHRLHCVAEGRDVAHFLDEIAGSHPVGRIADAEEVARFYVYMASDFASFFNGANLMIDGGYSSTA